MEASTQTADLERLLRHSEWLRTLARGLVRDASTAEDLVQETFLAALKNPPDPTRPAKPWLAGVMRNLVKLRARTEERRRRRQERAAKRDELPSTSELLENVDTGRRLAEEVVALAEPYRTTMLLHYYEELTAAEIARRQGIPAGTVRWRIKRGLEELRARLDRAWTDRGSWCMALGALVREGKTGELITGSVIPQALLLGTAWKAGLIAAMAALLAWLSLWAAKDVADSNPAHTAAIEAPRGTEWTPPESPSLAVDAPRIGSRMEGFETSALQSRLLVIEHDGTPAANWLVLVAYGDGEFDEESLDEQGRLKLPPATEKLDIFLARPNAPVVHLELEAGEGERELYLDRGREVAGRVRVAGRAPQTPLELRLSTDRPVHQTRLVELGLDLPVLVKTLKRGRKVRTMTDVDGAFRIHGIDPKWSGLVMLPEAYRLAGDSVRDYDGPGLSLYDGEVAGPIVHLSGPRSGVVIDIEPLPRLSGRIVSAESGEAVAHALYIASFEMSTGTVRARKPLHAGSDGGFELWFPDKGILGGALEYWDAEGNAGSSLDFSAESLEGDLALGDLPLAEIDALRLLFLDEHDEPISGARALGDGMRKASAESAADGRLTLSGVPHDTLTLFVGAPGRLGEELNLPTDRGAEIEVRLPVTNRLELRLAVPAKSVRFRLVADPGPFAGGSAQIHPIAEARLRGTYMGTELLDFGGATILRPSDGQSIELTGIEAGVALRVDVLDTLGRVAGSRDLAPMGSDEERVVTIDLDRPLRTLEGHALINGVEQLVGAMITISDGTGSKTLRTNRGGDYHFSALASETIDITVVKLGFVYTRIEGYVLGEHPEPLDFHVERGVAVRITVRDGRGRLVEDASARATRTDDAREWLSRRLDEGKLELPDMPSDRVLRIEVRAGGRVWVGDHDPLVGELEVELPD